MEVIRVCVRHTSVKVALKYTGTNLLEGTNWWQKGEGGSATTSGGF